MQWFSHKLYNSTDSHIILHNRLLTLSASKKKKNAKYIASFSFEKSNGSEVKIWAKSNEN